MINDKKDTNICGLTYPLCEKSLGIEVSGDFTLPDYQNEIRRVLHVFANVLPPAKYVSGGSVEFSGTVDYQMLYIGGDGGLYSVPLSSDYSFSVPIEGDGSGCEPTVLCGICVENTSTRVSAPRKVTLKSRLCPSVRAMGSRGTDVAIGEGAPIESIYKKNESCRVLACESATSDIMPMSYIVPLASEDMRVVFADGAVKINDISPKESRVECSGDVCLSLLCLAEDSGEYSVLEGKVPFDGEVDLEACTRDMSACADGVISELTVNVTDAGIECNVGVILRARCMAEAQSEYTSDVYSTAVDCECVLDSVSTRSLAMCENVNFTLSERVPLSESGVPSEAKIIKCIGSACVDKCDKIEGKYVLSGKSVFTVVYETGGEVSAADISIPLKYTANGTAERDAASFGAEANVFDVRCRLADGNVCIDCEVVMSYDCLCANEVTVAQGVRFGEAVEQGESELVVCYPDADDTLWSVAKKYKVPPTAVIGTPSEDKYVMIEY